jgi:hypothetical protein
MQHIQGYKEKSGVILRTSTMGRLSIMEHQTSNPIPVLLMIFNIIIEDGLGIAQVDYGHLQMRV